MDKSPPESEVLGWFDLLSNCTVGGGDDQRGAMDFVAADVWRRDTTPVRKRTRISCVRKFGDRRMLRRPAHGAFGGRGACRRRLDNATVGDGRPARPRKST